ncbi:hypothetical protein STEG23_009783, partial [Scotinomys teguina]
MWSKRNTPPLLVGMQIGTTTLESTLSLNISCPLFLLGEFASSHSRAFSFNLVDLSIDWNLPSSTFFKAVLVDRLGLFMVSQISWTFCFMTFLDFVFSLTDESISSILVAVLPVLICTRIPIMIMTSKKC